MLTPAPIPPRRHQQTAPKLDPEAKFLSDHLQVMFG